MEYIHGTSDFVLDRNSAVTLGKFDGIHMGDKKLISIVLDEARKKGLKSCVFTFDGLPLSICPQKYQHFLTTNSERRAYFESLGLDVEVEYITDMETVMGYGVMSMPAIVVNEKVVSMGKVLKAADVEKLLRKLGY